MTEETGRAVTMPRVLVGLTLVAVVVGAGISPRWLGDSVAAQSSAKGMPVFKLDPAFPKLPNNWIMGATPGVCIDRHDHVWVLHRPRTVPEDKRNLAAPAVLEFDANGKFLNAWGGPGKGFDWPDTEHTIYVDPGDNVWIAGTSAKSPKSRSDDMLLKFTNKGTFLKQIGGYDVSGGNKDTKSVQRAADAFMDPKTNELYVADGYGNHRVIVFDADTLAFKRLWGAFGNVPEDTPPTGGGGGAGGTPQTLDTEGPGSPQFGVPIEMVRISNDRLLYVVDRANRRVQVFTPEGKYLTQAFFNREGPSVRSVAGIAFSADRNQQFLFMPDLGNNRVLIVDRKSMSVLYQFGRLGSAPGEFNQPHHIAADSKNNLYITEVNPGNRVQRFLFTGMSPTPPVYALTKADLDAALAAAAAASKK